MKKGLFLILICLFSISSFAIGSRHIKHRRIVKTEGHIMFKGLSLNQNIDIFTNKLIALGYKQSFGKDTIEHVTYLKGVFAEDSCNILIGYTPITKKVAYISLFSDPYTDWQLVKDRYVYLKEQYSLKYGKPFHSEEHSLDRYLDEDSLEMKLLEKPGFRYLAEYHINYGIITLTILKGNNNYPMIGISYVDTINFYLSEKEKNSKVQNDI